MQRYKYRKYVCFEANEKEISKKISYKWRSKCIWFDIIGVKSFKEIQPSEYNMASWNYWWPR